MSFGFVQRGVPAQSQRGVDQANGVTHRARPHHEDRMALIAFADGVQVLKVQYRLDFNAPLGFELSSSFLKNSSHSETQCEDLLLH